MTDTERLEFIRERRLEGRPLSDDPLKNLRIIQEGERGVPLLEELAIQVQDTPKPRSWIEAERLHDQRDANRRRQNRAEELRATVAVIAGSTTLSEAVELYASYDWLERELDEQARLDDIVF